MKPLRVAFDARDLTASAQRGMVRYIVGLARHLPASGVRVTLFHRAREPLNAAHLAGLGCEVVGLRDMSGLAWEQGAVPLALARGGFDLYHAPAERGVPLAAPCPVVLTIHSATSHSYRDLIQRGKLPGPVSRYLGYDPARANRIWAAYTRLQLRRANHFFTVSEFARDELVRLMRLPPSRVTVTPLALPEAFTHQRDDAAGRQVYGRLGLRPPYLLYVGGFEPHKNVPGLFPVLNAVRRVRPDLQLVIVGTGSAPSELITGAAAVGLVAGRDVVFHSDLRDDLVHVYDGAAALISMSWRESFGVPFLEAMSRGLGVVASGWGAAGEVVGEAGELVDPRDPDAAAAALERVLADPTRYSVAGRAQVAKFTWERTAAQTATVYRSLVGRGTP